MKTTKDGEAVKSGWGLVRVSTTAQAEVQHGSIEQQVNMLNRWAEQQTARTGIKFVIERIIQEEESGRKTNFDRRKGLQEVRRAIRGRQIKFIIVEKIDRLSRYQAGNQVILDEAAANGVEVYELESGLIDLRDRGKRLGFNIKNMLAEEYSLELQEKIAKKVREARFNNGKDNSTTPLIGLDAHPTKTGIYIINPTEQEIVIDIFKSFLRMGALKALTDYCKERDYKTKVRWTKEKIDRHGDKHAPVKIGGKAFDIRSLHALLCNPKYCGFGFFKDDWNQFPNEQDAKGMVRWNYTHGPVVDISLFEKAQELLARNARFTNTVPRTNSPVYYLSGAFQMPDGSMFQGESAKSGKNPYYFNRKNKIRLPKDKIEEIVLKRVRGYLRDSGTLDKVIGRAVNGNVDGIDRIATELQAIRNKIAGIAQITEGFSQAIRDAVIKGPQTLYETTTVLIEEKKKAETELEALHKELSAKESQQQQAQGLLTGKSIQEYLELAMEKFENCGPVEKKRIIQEIIPEIIWHQAEKKLELRINPDPNGVRRNHQESGHNQEEKVRLAEKWWTLPDLNRGPPRYEREALTS